MRSSITVSLYTKIRIKRRVEESSHNEYEDPSYLRDIQVPSVTIPTTSDAHLTLSSFATHCNPSPSGANPRASRCDQNGEGASDEGMGVPVCLCGGLALGECLGWRRRGWGRRGREEVALEEDIEDRTSAKFVIQAGREGPSVSDDPNKIKELGRRHKTNLRPLPSYVHVWCNKWEGS
jgi:hypothetical protein